MAVDQNSIPKDLRPLNLTRTIAEDPRIAARNLEGFFPNSVRDVLSPRSRPVLYPATVSDSGVVGLGFGNPAVASWCPRPAAPVGSGGVCDAPNSGYGVGGNAGVQVSDEGPDDSISGKKVKFLCSFGGKIIPRPSDGMLRYVGGQTRIISVRRDVRFHELVQKMIDTYGQPVAIKYQLPDEDLDALVSVSCPEDLENMMEEFEKLVESSSDGSVKLRVFLFSATEVDQSGIMQFGDLHDCGQRYVDAVNGISDFVAGGITRKESMTSATSTQNSDSLMSGAEAIDSSGPGQGEGGGLPSPSLSVPLGMPVPIPFSSRLEPELERPVLSMGQQQQLQPLGFNLQQPPPAAYMQAYVDPHPEAFNRVDYPQLSSQIGYMNPQMLGIAGSVHKLADHQQQFLDNTATVSPQFIPAVHMTMTSGVQQFMQPQQTGVDPYPEEMSSWQNSVQLPGEQNYKAYQAHAPPPQASVPLQAGGYGWKQMPLPEHAVLSDGWVPHQQGMFPEKIPRFEDCYMCQKALPHAHSDTLVQDHKDSTAGTVSDANPVYQSLHLEDNMRARPANRVVVTGALGEGTVEQQGAGARPLVAMHLDHEVGGLPLDAVGFYHNPEVQHGDERIILQKPDPRMLFPPGVMRLTGDVQSPYGVFTGNIPQSFQEDTLQQPSVQFQYQVKQEALVNKLVGTDIPPVRCVPLQTSEPLVHESATDYSGKLPGFIPKEDILRDHLRAIDGRMEALHICTPEISSNNEQCRSPVNKPKLEDAPVNRPQIAEKDMFRADTLIKPGIVDEVIHTKPNEMLPSSSAEITSLHKLQPVEFNQVAQPQMLGDPGPYPHSKIGIQQMAPDEIKLAFSGVDSAYVTDRIPPIGEWKDEASQFQLRVPNDAAVAPSNGNAPSSLSPSKRVVRDNQDPAPSNSLFSNHDPWILQHDGHFPPPRPYKLLTGKEAFVTRDPFGENHLGISWESIIEGQLGDGVLHPASGNLSKDSSSEQVWSTKGSAEEHIKQELQAVAEGVAASILQSSMPANPDFFSHEINEYVSEANQDREVQDGYAETQSSAKVEDIKAKLPDKMSPGVPLSDGIGRLQIIKNSDLEELQELGSGTFGTVYHGKWRGSDVAIKRINDRCFAGKPSEQERMRDDFWNEAIKLADLHHPNVVAFYGVVLDGPGGSVATVTEYMVNGSLRNALQRNERILDKRKLLLIAMDVAFGMEYLHGKNIVHFDLKSDNLLVNLRDPHRPICKVSGQA
ncbi:hypothetical protein HHK36_013867 [Tetracentron sinense]|uniref:Protein kinase domain-containing protein n=1 Tax=Tetracentron sinense TaxID=13715 RepID=A0A834Z8W6_TETSI|nr:hypothetical protein HHK36_013867 [Tetracentron sinense]